MNRWIVGFVLVGAAAAFGCGTKGDDCASFVKVANANVEALNKSKAASPKELASAIKHANDAAKSVAIKDDGLKALIKEYTDIWDKGAAAATALESGDDAAVTKAKADIEAMEKSESVVVDKINKYCN